MPTQIMPCEWPVLPCGPLPPAGEEYDALHDAAAEVLWHLSGSQFGCCERTVRPCQGGCEDQLVMPWPNAMLVSGEWVNLTCRTCYGRRRCDCSRVCEVRLDGPVCALYEVWIGGEPVPTGSFRVDDGAWLVRTDGGCYPACQSESDPWWVRYGVGAPVPSGGQRALGELMAELYRACQEKPCALPAHLQTLAKQGITVGMFNPLDFLKEGKTGLYFTDLWLSAVNPLGRPRAARVASPDYDPGRVQTWP